MAATALLLQTGLLLATGCFWEGLLLLLLALAGLTQTPLPPLLALDASAAADVMMQLVLLAAQLLLVHYASAVLCLWLPLAACLLHQTAPVSTLLLQLPQLLLLLLLHCC
jgi:hypothetical protein